MAQEILNSATQPAAAALPQANYALLGTLSLLNDYTSTYHELMEIYPDLVRDCYLLMREAGGDMSGIQRGAQERFTPNQKFFHWEKQGKDMVAFLADDSPAQPGAGVAVTVTLSPESHFENGTLSDVAISQTWTNTRTGEAFYVTATNTTTPDAHTVTLKPDLAAVNPSVLAGDWFIYTGTITGEAAGTYDGLYPRQQKIEGMTRTIRDYMTVTDYEEMNVTEIQINGVGAKYSLITSKALDSRFSQSQEVQLMMGSQYTNFANNAAGQPGNQTFQGLVPAVQARGNTISNFGQVDDNFFNNIKRVNEAEGYSNEFDMLHGIELGIKIQAWLRSQNKNGAILYAKADSSSVPMELQKNFDSYNVNMLKINFHDYAFFNPARVWSLPLLNGQFINSALCIPRGFGYDSKSGAKVSRFQIRYNKMRESDPIIRMISTGGLITGQETTQDQKQTTSYLTNKGLQTFGLNGYLWCDL